MGNWRMPWGVFRGREVEDIPSGYLRWLSENCEDDEIATIADVEYRDRSNWNTHFYEDQGISPGPNIEMERIEAVIDGGYSKKRKENVMGDDFVPASIKPQPVMSSEMKANIELAKAVGDNRVAGIIQASVALKKLEGFNKIETQTQYDQAIDSFDLLKGNLKSLEEIRHEYVDYPTLVTKVINSFFKQLRDGMERTKKHIGGLIERKKQVDEAAALRALEESKDGNGVVVTDDGDGMKTINFDGKVDVPLNVISSAKGAKVHSRKDIHVEIEDLLAFLKVCVSKAKGYQFVAEAREEIVSVNMAALRRLIKENGNKKIPGVKITSVSKTV